MHDRNPRKHHRTLVNRLHLPKSQLTISFNISLGLLLQLNLVKYHYDLSIALPTASVSFNNPYLFVSNNAHYRTMRLRLASLIILLPAILAAPLLRHQSNLWGKIFGDDANNGVEAGEDLLEPVLGIGEHSSISDRLG
jgi:hypothetical protein